MSKQDLRKALPGTWYRATEEETGEGKVFLPVKPGGQVPPGRNRELLTLNPDGTLIEGSIAATDALTEAEGKWELEGNELILHLPSAKTQRRVIRTVLVGPDRIVIKK